MLRIQTKNMDKIDFGISLKTIPIPDKREYLQNLVTKTEDLIRRMRWRAYFFLSDWIKHKISKTIDAYEFNLKTAPFIDQLKKFKMDLFDIIKNISFHNHKNNFQKHLDTAITEIKQSKQIFVKSDKTTNSIQKIITP